MSRNAARGVQSRLQARTSHVGDLTMRLAAMACALMIVMCVAVFGAILSQRPSAPIASTSPAQAAPAAGPVRVVTTLEEASAPAPVQAATKPIPAPDATPATSGGGSSAPSSPAQAA